MMGRIKAPQPYACVIRLCPSPDYGLSIRAFYTYSPNEAEGGKGQKIAQNLRSAFCQLLRLLTQPKTAENNYPLSKMERSREEIVPF